MKKNIILTILFFAPFIIVANSNNNLFTKANELYNEAKYYESIKLYDSLISSEIESAPIYYNLGNAYFKINEIPSAILYYEKAKKIEPNNKDIIYNLELANTKIADRIEIVPEFFIRKWHNSLINSLNEKEWMLINILIFTLLLFTLITFFISNTNKIKRYCFYVSILLIALFIFSWANGNLSKNNKISNNFAIIFTPTLNIKSAPDDNSNTLFILHKGSKIEIIESSKQWRKIKISNGSEGWLKKDDFKKI